MRTKRLASTCCAGLFLSSMFADEALEGGIQIRKAHAQMLCDSFNIPTLSEMLKHYFPLPLSVMLVCMPSLVHANQALSQRYNCTTCHSVSARVVGPSFKEVAAKYANQDDAVNAVAERIVKGSSGRWGIVPMPANSQITPGDSQALAKWVLEQK